MSKKLITINGRDFEYCGKTEFTKGYRDTFSYYNWNEILNVYGKPSIAKIYIWHDWCEWCHDVKENGANCGIGISGHNCTQFTINGFIDWNDGKSYYIYITKCHNRIYEVQYL